MNQYEAMFLFDPTFGASWENCENEIGRLMERAEAEVLFCRLWDERRLAYRIRGRKRGVYVLVYFKADPSRIAAFERDAQLSENVLRVLLLRADGVTREAMDRAFVQTAGERANEGQKSEPSTSESPSAKPETRKDEPAKTSVGE